MYLAMNPDYFKGTVIEGAAASLLAGNEARRADAG
jgi:hypothetical protein